MNQNLQMSPAQRFTMDFHIELKKNYSRRADSALLRNISATGAFLENPVLDLRKDEKLNVVFNVGGYVRTVPANVIWTNKNGAGVVFKPFNKRDRQIIDDFIYFIQEKRTNQKDVLTSIFERVYSGGDR